MEQNQSSKLLDCSSFLFLHRISGSDNGAAGGAVLHLKKRLLKSDETKVKVI